jgi:hypothetical protein
MSSHVVVDGSNIATEGRNLPSLVQLDEAVRAFLAERPHDSCIVVVDATFEHRIDSSEKRMFDEAVAAGELVTPPAGTIGRGDKFLLEIAERTNATVFSNDSFQEFHGEYDWLFDEGRLVGGKPVPGVGWILTARNPVRGAKSRMATQRAATKKRVRRATGSSAKKAAKASPRSMAPEPEAPVVAATPRGGATTSAGTARGPRRSSPSTVPVNAALPFIEFITEHPLGATVKGEVVEFTSHGAYVNVGDVRCYLGLRHLGNPPPRSAREVLTRGEEREFIVQSLDAPRRGIDLALPGFERIDPEAFADAEPSTGKGTESTPRRREPRRRPSSRPATAHEPVTAEASSEGVEAAAQASAAAGAFPTQSEAILAQQPVKKKAARTTKAAGKKSTKKVSAAKSTAKKSAKTATGTVKKSARKASPSKKKATATRKTGGTKATATRKAAGKKAAATRKRVTATRKAAGKKAAVTRKATAQKAASTRKTAAKKAATTKAVKATKTAATAVRRAVVKGVRT